MANEGPRRETEGERVQPGALSALLQELAAAPAPAPRAESWGGILRAGIAVGRFELVRELGRGGFGVVWEARDRELGRSVAFKALTGRARPEMGEERLLAEAEAAARLSHPNIVTLHDVGRTEHGPYLVLELLRGMSLRERLRHGRVAPREAVRIAAEVAKGLAHAHAQGVVHRDLTPGNVFLCEDGQVKVLDLGMAHAFGRRKLDGGTPAYMPPEQRRGAPEDERTDVFALGCVLHEMLTGEPPFSGSRPPRTAPPLDVAEAPGLGELLGRMLENDPVRRPRDAREVLAPLSAFQRELEAPSAGSTAGVVRRRRRAVRIAVLVALGIAFGVGTAVVARRFSEERAPAPAEAPSIAVLPFEDLSPHHDQEYFSDGLAEEILNSLARVEGLRVPARTSSFFFKGKNAKLTDIGRELGVAAVLEGSVRTSGDRVRVAARIVNIANGERLWGAEYHRDLGDIFAVQDEIAMAVVDALRVKLLPRGAPSASDHRTRNPEAYRLFLAGQQFERRGTEDGERRALAAFSRALELDPAYAPAAAGVSSALTSIFRLTGVTSDVQDVEERARAAAERAIALAPRLPDGYLARARIRFNVWNWSGAEADVRQALELDPASQSAQALRSWLLGASGRLQEAAAMDRKLTERDPLSATAWNNLGWQLLATGDIAAARDALRRALELSPEYDYAVGNLAISYLLEEKPADALATWERCAEDRFRLLGRALAHHDLGSREQADRSLSQLVARFGEELPYRVAEVHAWRGERDQAFEWLDRAFQRRDPNLTYLSEDPLVRKIRADPRYGALLRRMGLSAG